jgi:hypothetical protein
MPLQRVMRFAAAVVQERERITGEARNARTRRSSPDGDFVVFGEHVDSRFSAHGIDPTSVVWDSYRREDAQWVVSAGWHGGDLKRVARWTFTLNNRSVTPIDETATDLLSDRPIRPVVHVVYDVPITDPSDSPTGPIPMPGLRDELFDQQGAASKPAAEPAPSSVPPVSIPPLSVLPLRSLPEPSEPLPPLIPGFGSSEDSDDDRAARARIPSWDDILMGVRRKRD